MSKHTSSWDEETWFNVVFADFDSEDLGLVALNGGQSNGDAVIRRHILLLPFLYY